jgi:hypothetical protein
MIYNITENNFPYNDLTMHKPIIHQGTNIMKLVLQREVSIPIFIQLPQCNMSKSKKRTHCDLIFSADEVSLLEWIEQFEEKVKKLIFENKEWFETDLEESDIEQFLIPSLKWVRTNKNYTWKSIALSPELSIYNESGYKLPNIDDLDENIRILCILEIRGVRFSSKSFQIEPTLKQIMVTQTPPLFENCLIKSITTPIVLPHTDSEIVNEKDLDEIEDTPPLILKNRTDVYKKIYEEAYQKARMAKKVALSAYLEAKRIKNLYMLEDLDATEDEEFELASPK